MIHQGTHKAESCQRLRLEVVVVAVEVEEEAVVAEGARRRGEGIKVATQPDREIHL